MAPVVYELSIKEIAINHLLIAMAVLFALAELTHIYFTTLFIYQPAKSVSLSLFPLATVFQFG